MALEDRLRLAVEALVRAARSEALEHREFDHETVERRSVLVAKWSGYVRLKNGKLYLLLLQIRAYRNPARPGELSLSLGSSDGNGDTITFLCESPSLPEYVRTIVHWNGRDVGEARLDDYAFEWARAIFREWFAGVATQDATEIARLDSVSRDVGNRAGAALEPLLRGLDGAAQANDVSDEDEAFIRSTLASISLWVNRDGARPQILELYVADLVERFIHRLADPAPIIDELTRIGASHDLAEFVAERMVEQIVSITVIGSADSGTDAVALDRLADTADSIADSLRGIEEVQRRNDRVGSKVVDGLIGGTTQAIGSVAVGLVQGNWTQIQVGLSMVWRALRDLFVR